MKLLKVLTFTIAALLCTSCRDSYDEQLCRTLSDKIVRDEQLTQDDYAEMLDQYECILRYLISTADNIVNTKDANRKTSLQQQIREDKEFMERFSYMFTFGSKLYRAEVDNNLDAANLDHYKSLERYSDEFARCTEQM